MLLGWGSASTPRVKAKIVHAVLRSANFGIFFFFFSSLSSPSKSVPGFAELRPSDSDTYCVALNRVFYFDWSSQHLAAPVPLLLNHL